MKIYVVERRAGFKNGIGGVEESLTEKYISEAYECEQDAINSVLMTNCAYFEEHANNTARDYGPRYILMDYPFDSMIEIRRIHEIELISSK